MKRKFLFILFFVLTILICFGLFTQFKEEKKYKRLSSYKESSLNKKEKSKSKSTADSEKLEFEEKEEENFEVTDINENSFFSLSEEDKSITESSSLVVDYIEQTVDTAIRDDEVSNKNESKLKNTFVLLTDFIFYNGKIKGYTFSELKTAEKEKIVNSWEKLDAYIEKKYPNYKEKIKDTSSKNYLKIKEKLAELKENINNTFREKLGEETYSNTVNQFNEDKENFDNTIDPYKKAGKSAVEKAKEKAISTKEKIKDWYHNYKESDR